MFSPSLQQVGSVSAGKIPDIVVMERHTGRLVTGAHAPTAANLTSWLTKHPTFEVLRPGQRAGHMTGAAATGSTGNFYKKTKSKLQPPGK